MANNVTAMKRPVDKALVSLLQAALRDAESGDLVGVVVLGSCVGGAYRCDTAGDSELGQMMLAFEAWKFRQIAARELENSGVR